MKEKPELPKCERAGCLNRIKREFVRRKGVKVRVRWCSIACVPSSVHQKQHTGPIFNEHSFADEFAALQGRITRAQLYEQFRDIARRYFRYGQDSAWHGRHRERLKQAS